MMCAHVQQASAANPKQRQLHLYLAVVLVGNLPDASAPRVATGAVGGSLAASNCCGSRRPGGSECSRRWGTACRRPCQADAHTPRATCLLFQNEIYAPCGCFELRSVLGAVTAGSSEAQKLLKVVQQVLTWWRRCGSTLGCDGLTGLHQVRRHQLIHLLLKTILQAQPNIGVSARVAGTIILHSCVPAHAQGHARVPKCVGCTRV